jgi:hypothetical protein
MMICNKIMILIYYIIILVMMLVLGLLYINLSNILIIKIVGIMNIMISSLAMIIIIIYIIYVRCKINKCCEYFTKCQENGCCHAFVFFGSLSNVFLTLGALVGIFTHSYLWSLMFELTAINLLYWVLKFLNKKCSSVKVYPVNEQNKLKIVGIDEIINSEKL